MYLLISPTYVGITLQIPYDLFMDLYQPHLRGDYSAFGDNSLNAINQPHLRGDYSPHAHIMTTMRPSAPLTWGLLCWIIMVYPIKKISPTYVGITRKLASISEIYKHQPHLRGDYSIQRMRGAEGLRSAPR